MKILKLRASFGKLNGELCLQEGMNLLVLPNEAGKSTWSAFVLAMLYGIDTKERSSAANAGLPAKERYKPWDGKPMEGMMELLWQGRRITVERSSTAKAPMGVFCAYDTDSGQAIRELTAENCGKVLCGVERSVFERTAFIRQLGLSVTEDSALEQRMNALVSTGEEGAKSATVLEKELQQLKNRISGRAGRIVKLQDSLEETQRALRDIDTLRENAESLRTQKEAAQEEKEHLSALLQRIERAKQAQKHAALQELKQQTQAQEEYCEKLEACVQALPTEFELRSLQKELEAAEGSLQTAQMEAAFVPQTRQKPNAPECFSGLTLAEAEEKVAADTEEYTRLVNAKQPKKWPILPCLLLLLLGVGLYFYKPVIGLCVAGFAALTLLACILILFVKLRKLRKNTARAEEILRSYRVLEASEISENWKRYAAELNAYEEAAAQEEGRREILLRQLVNAKEQLAAVSAKVQLFAPECNSAADCGRAISDAISAYANLANETRACEQMKAQLGSMCLLLGEQATPVDTEALQLDEAKLRYELRAAEQKLLLLSDKLSEQRGKISAKGDETQLLASCEILQAELEQAREAAQTVELATEALTLADSRLRSRFSPRITAEAGKILSELTLGKYANVLLEPDMRLCVREDTRMRPAAAMSCGTADQMYLALRLAMSRLLLPEDAPLILDDALINFDEDRCTAALQLLKKEAESRQIVLFSCRSL